MGRLNFLSELMLNFDNSKNVFSILSMLCFFSFPVFFGWNGNITNYPLNHTITEGHIAALILARGGSKGIKMKNLSKLHNVTLLSRAINTINKFGRFNSVWVSTDERKIAEEAQKSGVNIHWRANYTATDEASSFSGVREFIDKHPEVSVIALIQCTSPFIRVEYLTKAYEMVKLGYHSVFSVTRQFKLRWKIKSDGTIEPDNFKINSRPRRQDWDGEMIENGMFYFAVAAALGKSDCLQSGKIGFIEIPANESMEIDSNEDLVLAESLMKVKDWG